MTIKQIIKILKDGGVGVMPTDTIYGLVGQALKQETVARIYKLKQRRLDKPCIVLIGNLTDLRSFSVWPASSTLKTIKRLWPGPISVIFTKTLACRLPAPSWLRQLLKRTGPLIATSANPEGNRPAQTIAEARKYFGPIGRGIDFYLAGGRLADKPSTLVKIKNGKIIVVRK